MDDDPKRHFKEKILEVMGDGEWRTAPAIARSVISAVEGCNPASVRSSVSRLSSDGVLEKRPNPIKVGGRFEWRLPKSGA